MKRQKQIQDLIAVCKIRTQKCLDLVQTVKQGGTVDEQGVGSMCNILVVLQKAAQRIVEMRLS